MVLLCPHTTSGRAFHVMPLCIPGRRRVARCPPLTYFHVRPLHTAHGGQEARLRHTSTLHLHNSSCCYGLRPGHGRVPTVIPGCSAQRHLCEPAPVAAHRHSSPSLLRPRGLPSRWSCPVGEGVTSINIKSHKVTLCWIFTDKGSPAPHQHRSQSWIWLPPDNACL